MRASAEASEALTKAVESYTESYWGRHYLSGIAEVYLGLIAGEQQRLDDALAHFEQDKRHYDASYGKVHANHGDLLVNRAGIGRRNATGKARLCPRHDNFELNTWQGGALHPPVTASL